MDSCCATPLTDASLPLDLIALAGMGLLMSLGHCVGMCGPLLAAVSVSLREGSESDETARRGRPLPLAALRPLVVYHAGRLTSYMALGGLLGLIGSAAGLARDARPFQAGLSMAAGILMLALGFGLLGLLPTRRWVESSRLAMGLWQRVGRWARSRSRRRHFLLGVANGLLPCGPVYAAAIPAAASSSLLLGMAAMAAYGLGTLPALLVLGLGSQSLGARLRLGLFRLGSVLVLLIAAQMLLRGLAAVEVVPHLRLSSVVLW